MHYYLGDIMWLFNKRKKLDPYLKAFTKTISRTKLPIVISYKGDLKSIKNKLRYKGINISYEYTLIPTVSANVPIDTIDKISTIPEVLSIYYDHKANLCINKAVKSLTIDKAINSNLTGRDVSIGLIDSGVFPHKGLTSKPNTLKYFKDIVNNEVKPYDDYGHGTYISGIISSNFDYAKGIAPDSSLSVIKAFDKTGSSNLSTILRGLEDLYLSTPEIKILLLPFEIPNLAELRMDPLYEIIKLIHSKDVIIICPSGNNGPYPYSINKPASFKEVLTVGGSRIKEDSFEVSPYSSRGPLKKDYLKPDILSLSEGIISLKSDIFYMPNNKLIETETIKTTSFSGTSVSSALITGMVSLLIEKYGNLSPKDIKSILYLGAKSIGENKNTQGKGIVIFDKLIKK